MAQLIYKINSIINNTAEKIKDWFFDSFEAIADVDVIYSQKLNIIPGEPTREYRREIENSKLLGETMSLGDGEVDIVISSAAIEMPFMPLNVLEAKEQLSKLSNMADIIRIPSNSRCAGNCILEYCWDELLYEIKKFYRIKPNQVWWEMQRNNFDTDESDINENELEIAIKSASERVWNIFKDENHKVFQIFGDLPTINLNEPNIVSILAWKLRSWKFIHICQQIGDISILDFSSCFCDNLLDSRFKSKNRSKLRLSALILTLWAMEKNPRLADYVRNKQIEEYPYFDYQLEKREYLQQSTNKCQIKWDDILNGMKNIGEIKVTIDLAARINHKLNMSCRAKNWKNNITSLSMFDKRQYVHKINNNDMDACVCSKCYSYERDNKVTIEISENKYKLIRDQKVLGALSYVRGQIGDPEILIKILSHEWHIKRGGDIEGLNKDYRLWLDRWEGKNAPETFKEAYSGLVIVFDVELAACNANTAMHKLMTSTWASRGWTWQEARYSKTLKIITLDGLVELPHSVKDQLIGSATSLEQMATQLRMRYWTYELDIAQNIAIELGVENERVITLLETQIVGPYVECYLTAAPNKNRINKSYAAGSGSIRMWPGIIVNYESNDAINVSGCVYFNEIETEIYFRPSSFTKAVTGVVAKLKKINDKYYYIDMCVLPQGSKYYGLWQLEIN